MYLKALCAYAESNLSDELNNPAFEEGLVHFVVALDAKGGLVDIMPFEDIAPEGQTTLSAPKSPHHRSGGLYPLPGCDAVQYILGADPAWTPEGKERNHNERHVASVELWNTIADVTDDPAVKACVAFYADPEVVKKARELAVERGVVANNRLALYCAIPGSTSPEPVVEREALRQYWADYYEEGVFERHASAGHGYCIVTGEYGPLSRTHDKIKHCTNIGGMPSGVSLISFNRAAFESFGWKQNQNCPMSIRASKAYVMALNDLLRYRSEKEVRTRYNIRGAALLCWTDEPVLHPPMEFVNNPDPDIVSAVLDAPKQGLTLCQVFGAGTESEPLPQVTDLRFHSLTVTANMSRMIVRRYDDNTIGEIYENVWQWFHDVRVQSPYSGRFVRAPALWKLQKTLADPAMEGAATKGKSPEDHIQQSLVWRALFNEPLDRRVLSRLLERIFCTDPMQRASQKLALLRVCLNDLEEGNVEAQLDHNNNHPAYLCGRLLAIYDTLQYKAIFKIQRTVAEQFFRNAAVVPDQAFSEMNPKARYHIAKLKRSRNPAIVAAGHAIDQRVTDVMNRIERFPTQQSPEDQALFAVGFYHQKAHDRQQAEEAIARKEAETETTESQ
jgi:CRISPR-associated protein Csd1